MQRTLLVCLASLIALVLAEPGKGHHCVFLHGAGVPGTGTTFSSFPAYWGNVHELVHCETSTFNFDNTEFGTNLFSDELQLRYYNLAKDADYVFGHSLANLLLAAACADKGLCLRWYNLGAPLAFPSTVAFLESACAQGVVEACEGRAAYSLFFDVPARYKKAADDWTVGANCGTNPYLTAYPSPVIETIAALLTAAGVVSDGVVEYAGCAGAHAEFFRETYLSNWYRSNGTHFDITCSYQNEEYGANAQKHCDWFRQMTLNPSTRSTPVPSPTPTPTPTPTPSPPAACGGSGTVINFNFADMLAT
eukprot:TRINITY_DN4179_c0_g1_i1.p1 TRINITY_DN4179_c0_g1~~TRINITY_DN4179_c0_g1_i1.p1  ORF type:complete len:306 (-),score=28.79 TRINITY_DN4179_c0_g1_i1:37-954(-)